MTGPSDGTAGAPEATLAPEFDAWVAARGPALLRLGYVLTGNAADAEDVVQDARCPGRWTTLKSPDLAAATTAGPLGRERLAPDLPADDGPA